MVFLKRAGIFLFCLSMSAVFGFTIYKTGVYFLPFIDIINIVCFLVFLMFFLHKVKKLNKTEKEILTYLAAQSNFNTQIMHKINRSNKNIEELKINLADVIGEVADDKNIVSQIQLKISSLQSEIAILKETITGA